MATTPPPPLTDHSIRTSGANGQGEQKHVKEKDTMLTDLPEKMRAFLRKNDIPVSVYDNNAPVVPRFVRVLKKANLVEEDIKEIESELGTTLERTPLPGIYQLAEERGLHGTSGYKSGKLFGIDLASAFAVHALDLKQGMHALDLCCAPGAKLCMIAEAVASQGKPAVLLLPQRGQQGEEGENGRNKPSSIAPTTVRGSVTGVDVALQRLNTCRNLIRKYRVMGVRLYLCDGARFGLPPSGEPILHCRILHVDESTGLSFDPKAAKKKKNKNKNKKIMAATIGRDSNCKNSNESNRSNKRRRTTTSNDDDETTTTTTTTTTATTTTRCCSSTSIDMSEKERGGEEEEKVLDEDDKSISKSQAQLPQGNNNGGYERVLVDAECTHDGSLKHMLKFRESRWEKFAEKVLDPKRMKELQELQRGLLKNGFRLLQRGGKLVYSTCSFCRSQNEDIVQWLLDTHKDARLLPPPPLLLPKDEAASMPAKGGEGATSVEHKFRPKAGFLRHTLRFDPATSHTSGLFLAILTKV